MEYTKDFNVLRSVFDPLAPEIKIPGSGVRIVSEKGRDCTVLNPWPGKPIVVYRDGKKAETANASGDRTVLKTKAGETIVLVQEGDSLPRGE